MRIHNKNGWEKKMNKSIIGLVLILVSGLASAACPDISGKWGYQATEVLGGNQFAAKP